MRRPASGQAIETVETSIGVNGGWRVIHHTMSPQQPPPPAGSP
jgi:hypothetical protein